MKDKGATNDPAAADRGDGAVDLGLEDLLRPKNAVPLTGYLAVLAEKRQVGREKLREIEVRLSRGVEETPLMKLAAEQSWEKLAAACERQLSVSGEKDWRAKLWWVRAQLEIQAIPAVVLAAPLDSASAALMAEIKSSPASRAGEATLIDSTIRALQCAADSLQIKGEATLALRFAERGLELTPAFTAKVRELLEHELSACQKQMRRRESSRVAARIKEIELGLQSLCASKSVGPESAPGEASLHQPEASAKSKLRMFIALSVAGISAMAWVWSLLNERPRSDATSAGYAWETSILSAEPTAGLVYPALQRMTEIGENTLADILDKLEEQHKQPQRQQPGDPNAAVLPRSRRQVAMINTSSPSEPLEVRNLRRSGPEADENQSEVYRVGEFYDPVLKGDARQNPIVAGDPYVGTTRKEFETGGEGRYCRVLASLWVRQTPSDSSLRLERLRAGQRVYMAEKMGRWLKIQSDSSGEGYVPRSSVRCVGDGGNS